MCALPIFTQRIGGSYTAEAAGAATIKAPSVTHDTPQTTSTGHQTVQGTMAVQGEGESGAVSTFAGSTKIENRDDEAEQNSIRGHGHMKPGSGGRTRQPGGRHPKWRESR